MALPGSGAISFAQLQTEFGGTNPISINEYYNGAGRVSNGAVPSSGQISLNQFYGLSAAPVVTVGIDPSRSSDNILYTAGYGSGYGSITGGIINGATILNVSYNESSVKEAVIRSFSITLSGSRAQSFFTSITLPDTTGDPSFTSASASSGADGGNTFWTWFIEGGTDYTSSWTTGITQTLVVA